MEYDKEKYKEWKLPHPLLLHWILNPGLAFNELILGQRVPKLTLIDKTSSAPLMERQYVPCPNCETLNDGRLWSKGNSFGHWFGYVCPKCGGRIPCLWNITSLILLTVTFPLWFFFKNKLEKRWLEKEKERFTVISLNALPEAKTTSWIKMGMLYGVSMFCFMSLPSILKNQASMTKIALQFIVWMGAGLLFGGMMKLVLGRKSKS